MLHWWSHRFNHKIQRATPAVGATHTAVILLSLLSPDDLHRRRAGALAARRRPGGRNRHRILRILILLLELIPDRLPPWGIAATQGVPCACSHHRLASVTPACQWFILTEALDEQIRQITEQ
jgi:hypothetical protein